MNPLRDLQAWYHARCNGVWEHRYGIRVGTLDNPGWSLDINLAGTSLEGTAFAEIKRNYEHATDWLICRVRDGSFEARCGPYKLEEAITVFLDWSNATESSTV